MSIYVGEDCPVESRLLRSLLQQHGQVQLFDNGLDLYYAIVERPPQLVIADLWLPDLDGFLLTRLLRFDGRYQALPVLCISSIKEPGLEERLESLGCSHFLAKPLEPDLFEKTVKRLLEAPEILSVRM